MPYVAISARLKEALLLFEKALRLRTAIHNDKLFLVSCLITDEDSQLDFLDRWLFVAGKQEIKPGKLLQKAYNKLFFSKDIDLFFLCASCAYGFYKNYRIEVHRDISGCYHNQQGILSSCMTGSSAIFWKELQRLADVSVAVLSDNDGNPKARALLWRNVLTEDNEQLDFLDIVYGEERWRRLLKSWALSEGFCIKMPSGLLYPDFSRSTKNIFCKLLREPSIMPYLDTMKYLIKADEGCFLLTSRGADVITKLFNQATSVAVYSATNIDGTVNYIRRLNFCPVCKSPFVGVVCPTCWTDGYFPTPKDTCLWCGASTKTGSNVSAFFAGDKHLSATFCTTTCLGYFLRAAQKLRLKGIVFTLDGRFIFSANSLVAVAKANYLSRDVSFASFFSIKTALTRCTEIQGTCNCGKLTNFFLADEAGNLHPICTECQQKLGEFLSL